MELPAGVRPLTRLWSRGRVRADIGEEFAFHLDARTAELIAGGLDPARARAEALRQFGDVADAATYCRRTAERRERHLMRTEWFSGVRQDINFAVRTLVRAPAFTIVAILTLALGIGANTAIFSVIRGILLRPFPFPDPDQLVMIAGGAPGKSTQFNVSPANALDWRAQQRAFTDLSIIDAHGATLTDGGAPEQVQSAQVSPGFFNILRVRPLIGRIAFTDAEAKWQGEKSVVLNEDLWRSRFGSNPKVVGSMITIDNDRYRVIGIVPSAMAWPQGMMLWTPFTYDPAQLADSRGGIYLNVIGRLRSATTLAAAQTDMNRIAAHLLTQYPDDNAGDAEITHVVPLNEWVTGALRTPLLVLLGGVGFVLLIACANVANLLMVRGAGRSTELAVRTALGAGRGRLVRQLVTESVLLAIAGGIVATLIAIVGTRLLVHVAPQNIPRLGDVHIDALVLAVTFAIALGVGLLFGLIPAVQLVRPDLAQMLRAGGRALGGGTSGNVARRVLVIAEVALAVMLLAGAGLMIRSFTRLMHVDPGFRTTHTIHFGLSLPEAKYPTQPAQAAFVETLLDRMRTVKGVETAGASFGMPLTPFGFGLAFAVAGRPPLPPAQEPAAQIRMATPDYFKAMGITMRRGRNFSITDRLGAPQVLLISAEAAKRFFPGEDPIGKHVDFGMSDPASGNRMQGDIVGIASDVKQSSLARPAQPQFWVPYAQYPMPSFNVVLHTGTIDPERVINEARRDLQQIDPNLAMTRIMTLDQMVSTAVAQPRFYMTLLTVFAVLALVLCSIGIYGVIAYLVGQRVREIGIRLALGSTPEAVVGMIVRDGALMVAIGLAIGIGGALALTRLMASLLYDTTPTDTGTYAGVVVILGVVAITASIVPALRAARIDPALTMRAD